MRVSIKLHYGKKWVDVDLPEDQILAVIDPKDQPGVSDEIAEIKRALDNPIGCDFFSNLSKRDGNAIIICDDYTRPTPAHKILPILLNRLNESGIEDVKIIIGSGTHRPMSEEEIKNKVGNKIIQRIMVMNHEWMNPETFVSLGKTPSGIPISVNKHVMNSKIKIGLGSIGPHNISGWSGGAKIIVPGVCSSETTGYTHWISARYPDEKIIGVVDNPVRREMEQVAKYVGLDFIVNTVLNRENKIVKVVAGDFVKAHRKGVEFSEQVYKVKVPEKADIVICDSHPFDVNLWQAVKAIFAASLVVKKGGTIVLLAQCLEGISDEHPEISRIGYRPYSEVKLLLERGEVKDLCAMSDAARVGNIITEKAKVIMCSEGISEEETKRLNFDYAKTPQEAVNKALVQKGSDSKIVVLRSASELLPYVK
ncbi:MAG: nickel-dependent lactate racemase [Candidatus Jordarchaeaceae archaeon]